jgi:hypothetical protein
MAAAVFTIKDLFGCTIDNCLLHIIQQSMPVISRLKFLNQETPASRGFFS